MENQQQTVIGEAVAEALIGLNNTGPTSVEVPVADNAPTSQVFTGVVAPKPHVVNKTAWEDGEATARIFIHADVTKRQAILAACVKWTSQDDKDDWLAGFGASFADKNQAKVRKSEAGTIFDAWALEKVRMPRLPIKTGEVIQYDERTGPEFLKSTEMTWNNYVSFARQMLQTAGVRKTAGPRVAKRITEKGMEKVELAVSTATPEQAKALISRAVDQIRDTSPKDWEHKLLVEIENLAFLLSESKQQLYVNLATTIGDLVTAELTRQSASVSEAAATEMLKKQAADDTKVPAATEAAPFEVSPPQTADIPQAVNETH